MAPIRDLIRTEDQQGRVPPKDVSRQSSALYSKGGGERPIVALLSHANTRTAAKAVGVDETTLWRWLQDKDFHAAYMTARRETVQHALARLQQVSTEAVKTLREVMRDKTAKGSERVSAAKAIIEYSIKAVEIEDMAERLSQVEAILAQQPAKK